MSTQDLFRLEARTVIITGAIGGLGTELTEAVLEQGGDVICLDRLDAVPEVEWERLQGIARENGGLLWYARCDITQEEEVTRVFEETMSKARHPLRGLVACAGITKTGASLDFSLEDWNRIFSVNTRGSFICAKAAARIVHRQKESASFVLIGSISAHTQNLGVANTAYCASKAAVLAMTRSLASEWGKIFPSIRVNSISPGYIKTPMLIDYLKSSTLGEMWTAQSMLGRLSLPHEYRGPIVFLLSDASSYMTASDLLIDGGNTSW